MSLPIKLSRLNSALLLALLLLPGLSRAALTIEITQGIEGALPIAVIPFDWQGSTPLPPQDIASIVKADLSRSGRFAPLPDSDLLARPHEGSQINFKNWRILGVENLIVGRLLQRGADLVVQFQLFDVYKGSQLLGFSIPTRPQDLRFIAHHISDLVYEKLTGERGAFTTQVAYVVARSEGEKRKYSLQIADADGYNPQIILSSDEPIMSPAWSPDGKRLAYVSFEKQRSEIYIQDVATGRREILSGGRGINGAPAWSPDGTKLAVTLTKRGNPDIFIIDVASRKLRQLTRNYAIDTEADWSPDGAHLLFTSDRGGKPQIYRIAASGGRAERLTFEGDYNARGRYAPSGNQITLVHGSKSRFHIAVLELDTGLTRLLTEGGLDESPSFAPNGRMIIYANEGQTRGTLAAVSIDGRVHQRLGLQEGDVREPAWSPYSTN